MGRNGSGKSTLANALMGHPKYMVTSGSVRLEGEDILALKPDERAKRGPVPGVPVPDRDPGRRHWATSCGRPSRRSAAPRRSTRWRFRKELAEACSILQMDPSFATRALNEGFSGGEKKRAEMLQMAMLKPRMAILDEPDSGLDIDAVRIVSDGINQVHEQQPEMGVLLITHYQRILNYINPTACTCWPAAASSSPAAPSLSSSSSPRATTRSCADLGIEDAEEAASHGR